MTEEILKAIPVFLSSMLKFILGPLEGYKFHLHFITTVLATVSGMMFSVAAFTFFGEWLRQVLLKRFFHKKNEGLVPNKKSNRLSWIIAKYGLGGIAFLTPVFLTPIAGTILAVSLSPSKKKILAYMFLSAVFWALVFTSITYIVGPEILKWFKL